MSLEEWGERSFQLKPTSTFDDQPRNHFDESEPLVLRYGENERAAGRNRRTYRQMEDIRKKVLIYLLMYYMMI